jgi:hypothetical protein
VIECWTRFFAALAGDEAGAVAARLRARLEPIAVGVELKALRPYWKIAAYHEVSFSLRVLDEPETAMSRLLPALGSGWLRLGELAAIWNYGPDSTFVEPCVRWAHVELFE